VFRHELSVRYSECDLQGVVFNAHYLAYCDHALDEFLRAALGEDSEFQLMLKSAQLTWHSPLRYREAALITVEVVRWGNSSMDVQFTATVEGHPRFDAVITYVAVDVTVQPPLPMLIPADVRAALA
jgi:acyl-CoA thioester hydrolase